MSPSWPLAVATLFDSSTLPSEAARQAGIAAKAVLVGPKKRFSHSTKMGHHDDRLAHPVDGLAHEAEDLGAAAGVEVAGGLVGEDHVGPAGQRPGHGDPLLLAARQLGGRCRSRSRRPTLSMTASSQARSGFRPARSIGRVMFSAAVSVGIRLNDWKTKPMPVAPQAGEGLVRQAPTARRRPGRPAAGEVVEAGQAVLGSTCPSPTGPMMAVNLPAGRAIDTPSSARTAVSPRP